MVFIIWLVFSILIGVLGNNKKIGFGWALFWALLLSPFIGLIIVLASDSKKKKSRPKYLDHRELGEKSEFKSHFKEAVDHYMDSLYHLENDYRNIKLSKQLEEIRQRQIVEITEKIDNIKAKNSDLFTS